MRGLPPRRPEVDHFVILVLLLCAKAGFIMELIKLEDSLKLDIPEIDCQHERLIGLINLLHEAMVQGAGRTVLDERLAQLLAHTQEHFAYEEQLMSQHNYPGTDAHQSEHNRLLQHLVDLTKRYKNGELLLSFAIVLELKGWAVVHIEKSDKPLGAFLNNREGTDAAPA